MLILPLVFSWKRRKPSAGSAGHRLRIHPMDKAQAFPVLFLSRTLTHSLPPSRPSLHSLARARACMCVLHVLSRTFLRETSCARERARAVCMCVYPRARESCGLGVRAGCFCPFLPNPIIPRPGTSFPRACFVCLRALCVGKGVCVCVCASVWARASHTHALHSSFLSLSPPFLHKRREKRRGSKRGAYHSRVAKHTHTHTHTV